MFKKLLAPMAFTLALSLTLAMQPLASRATDITIPMPDVTPANPATIPTHMPTYAQITGDTGKNSCYHVAGSDSFNGACNSNTGGATPGPGGTLTDTLAMAKAITMVDTNANGGEENYSGAGMKTILYEDVGLIHNGFTGFLNTSTNTITPGGSINVPCMNTMPKFTFINSKRYGNPVYLPNTNTAFCGTGYYGSVFGDVNPAAINYWANAVDFLTHKQLYGLGGFSGVAAGKPTDNGMTIVRWDDHDYPAHRFYNDPVACTNSPFALATPAGGGAPTPMPSCPVITTGPPQVTTRATRGDHPYFNVNRGTSIADDMDPQWVDGSRDLFRMPKRFGMASIFNDATDPTQIVYEHVPDRANLVGVQCEYCFGRNGANLWSENTWLNHINTIIATDMWNVPLINFNPTVSSIADEKFVYASTLLGILYPNGVVQGGLGYTTPNSNIKISPFVWLVPTEPSGDPANFQFDPFVINYDKTNVPKNYGAYLLKQPGGAYVRNFNHLWIGKSGTPRDLGKCTVVVFHDPGTMPAVSGVTYSWDMSGSGIIYDTQFGGGDTGNITAAASIPAAGTSEPAGTAFILTANQ